MSIREWAAYVVAHPYPDPMILAGVAVALAFKTYDRWRVRRR